MKLTLTEPKYFKDSVSVLSELVSETRFKVNSDGITVIAVDPANVAMVIFKLLSSCFSEFDVKEDLEIGLNLNNLKQILKRVEASDILTLESDNSKLKITIKGKVTRKFSIPIIELDEKDKKAPELDFPVDVVMPASLIASAIEDADIVADSVNFICDTNKLRFVADGDLNNVEVEVEASDDVKISNSTEGTIKSKYSIEYLKKMMSGSKISNEVSIGFNKDYPIRISFTELDKVSISFVLAPRVETD